jgi:cell wall-associated NlpC family hydrolase
VTPLPGDFALTKIGGITGKLVSAGQALIGDAAPVQHAFVYVGDGMVVQAMPGGAELIRLEDASPVVEWSTGHFEMDGQTRFNIAMEARSLVGTPYSYLDYASLALAHFRVRPAWVTDYIASTGHLICSQLVDEVYLRAGVHLFDDGRLPGDVTPGDLWKLLNPRRVTASDRDLWRLANE